MSEDTYSEAEFLRSTATDIVTGEPLYDNARPDLYAIDARRIADRIEALEAENTRLRSYLSDIEQGRGMLGVNTGTDLIWAMEHARAALKGDTDE